MTGHSATLDWAAGQRRHLARIRLKQRGMVSITKRMVLHADGKLIDLVKHSSRQESGSFSVILVDLSDVLIFAKISMLI